MRTNMVKAVTDTYFLHSTNFSLEGAMRLKFASFCSS